MRWPNLGNSQVFFGGDLSEGTDFNLWLGFGVIATGGLGGTRVFASLWIHPGTCLIQIDRGTCHQINNILIRVKVKYELYIYGHRPPRTTKHRFQAVTIYDWNRYCVCSDMTWQRLTPGRLHADLWFPMAGAAQVRSPNDFSAWSSCDDEKKRGTFLKQGFPPHKGWGDFFP